MGDVSDGAESLNAQIGSVTDCHCAARSDIPNTPPKNETGRRLIKIRLCGQIYADLNSRLHADGSYAKTMRQMAKTDVLVMDDWGLAVLSDQHRRDLLEILDDRYNLRATVTA
ncbi:MAG: ATP-binding protein [Gallionellaceae bacterium]|nr:ATP-binding protein [Gallionellaceae bacterium]